MKNIKGIEEFITEERTGEVDIRVKDLIEFLSKYDPETKVHLDKDGWQDYDNTGDKNDIISYLIDDSSMKRRGADYIMINN
jgi:hypothetical protein